MPVTASISAAGVQKDSISSRVHFEARATIPLWANCGAEFSWMRAPGTNEAEVSENHKAFLPFNCAVGGRVVFAKWVIENEAWVATAPTLARMGASIVKALRSFITALRQATSGRLGQAFALTIARSFSEGLRLLLVLPALQLAG